MTVPNNLVDIADSVRKLVARRNSSKVDESRMWNQYLLRAMDPLSDAYPTTWIHRRPYRDFPKEAVDNIQKCDFKNVECFVGKFLNVKNDNDLQKTVDSSILTPIYKKDNPNFLYLEKFNPFNRCIVVRDVLNKEFEKEFNGTNGTNIAFNCSPANDLTLVDSSQILKNEPINFHGSGPR